MGKKDYRGEDVGVGQGLQKRWRRGMYNPLFIGIASVLEVRIVEIIKVRGW